jgi:PKD repeat protein
LKTIKINVMKKGLFFALLFSLVSYVTTAQMLSVDGVVLSEETEEPVAGQEMFIYVTNGEWSQDSTQFQTALVITDEEGYFDYNLSLQEFGFTEGFVQVSTFACGMNVEENQEYDLENLELEFEFEICIEDSVWFDECEAMFDWYPMFDSLQGNLNSAIQFHDFSYGDVQEYFWDFGDGTTSEEVNPVHEYAEEGEYEVCLTILANDGECESVFCQEVIVGDEFPWDECEAYFEYHYADSVDMNINMSEVYFYDLSLGEMNEWHWDFGDGNTSNEQNPVHEYEESGMYWVCLTAINIEEECESEFCLPVFVTVSASGDNVINGQVIADAQDFVEGEVLIMGLDNYHFDMVSLDEQGGYEFDNVPDGSYYLWAFPYGDSLNMEYMYLPTFYGNTPFFEDAELVVLGEAQNPYDINLVSLYDVIEGECEIQCILNGGFKSTLSPNMVAVLSNEFDEPVKYELIKVGQSFNFDNLAYGTYRLRVEAAGINSEPITIVLTPETTTVDVKLSTDGSTITSDGNASNESIAIRGLYPNPVVDQFVLELSSELDEDLELTIWSISGQEVMKQQHHVKKGINRIKHGTNNLRPGVYVLTIRNSKGTLVSKRLVK